MQSGVPSEEAGGAAASLGRLIIGAGERNLMETLE